MPLALAGCGVSRPRVEKVTAPETPQAPLQGPVESGAVTITARDKAGTTRWVARSKTSHTEFDATGNAIEDLATVDGDIYSENLIVSHFTSERAHADQNERRLELSGSVKVSSLKQGISAQADQAKWMEDVKLIAMEGNVIFASNVWTLGPAPVQWCKPDLTEVGTPDVFKQP